MRHQAVAALLALLVVFGWAAPDVPLDGCGSDLVATDFDTFDFVALEPATPVDIKVTETVIELETVERINPFVHAPPLRVAPKQGPPC